MFRRIRDRLIATYLIVVALATVFLGVHLAGQFEAAYTEQVKDDLLELARLIAFNAMEGLAAGDTGAIHRQLQGPYHDKADSQIFVVDASGIIIGGRAVPDSVAGTRAEDPGVGEALQGKDAAGFGHAPGREETIYAVVPVQDDGRVLGAVYVARPLTYLHAQLQHIRWVVAWATIVAFLLAGGLGLILSRGIAGPVQEMQHVASSLAAGRLSERVPVRTRDELGDLARALNYMASELERTDSSRRAFVADASHELRTPVANLAVAVEVLKAVLSTSPQQAAIASDVEREVQRLRQLVETLLDLSQVESGTVRLNLAVISMSDVISRAVQPFAARAQHVGLALKTEIPPRLSKVKADADRTVQVLTNLLDNALKFTPSGGTVTVSADEQRGHVLIAVTDTGPGIPEGDLPNIFDRFYKADRARVAGRGGAGLGLAIAKRLVEAQGGIIMVESGKGQGARFMVALPKAG